MAAFLVQLGLRLGAVHDEPARLEPISEQGKQGWAYTPLDLAAGISVISNLSMAA